MCRIRSLAACTGIRPGAPCTARTPCARALVSAHLIEQSRMPPPNSERQCAARRSVTVQVPKVCAQRTLKTLTCACADPRLAPSHKRTHASVRVQTHVARSASWQGTLSLQGTISELAGHPARSDQPPTLAVGPKAVLEAPRARSPQQTCIPCCQRGTQHCSADFTSSSAVTPESSDTAAPPLAARAGWKHATSPQHDA